MKTVATRRTPGRIGPWRLLDLVLATMPMRIGLMGGMAALPEFGPADSRGARDPGDELPNSNISYHEQRQAISRERMRRWREARVQ